MNVYHYNCRLGQVRFVCPGCLHTEQECFAGSSDSDALVFPVT